MSTIELIGLQIDDRAYNYAKIYSSLLTDEYQRKRSYASLVALYAFLNLLEKTPYNIQKAMTLFRNPQINEQFEVSDLYVNNWHLDVRVITDGDAVLVPKVHYDSDILPDYYVIVKINKELTKAELIGIADTSVDKHEAFDYNYNSIPLSSLISYDDFLNKIQNPKAENFTEDDHKIFEETYLSFMDNDIGQQSKALLMKHLFDCSECRTEFCCFTGFEMVSCNSSKYPDLFNDRTLGIVGAQDVDDKRYEGKEETVYIGDETSSLVENETSDKNSDVSSDSDDVLNDLTENKENKENKDEELDSFLDEIVEDSKETDTIDNIIDEISQNNEMAQNIVENDGIAEVISDVPEITEEREQTVSDILNELFEEEEEYIDNTADSEKTVETPLIEQPVADEIEKNADDSILESNIIENEAMIDFNENEELNIIKDSSIEDKIGTYDIIDNISSDVKTDNDEDGIVLINDDNTGLELIDSDKETVEASVDEIGTEVQKVIVDYDEFGEPIYSYITNIEDNEENINEIDSIDNIPSEEFSETVNDIEDNIVNNIEEATKEEFVENIEDSLKGVENSVGNIQDSIEAVSLIDEIPQSVEPNMLNEQENADVDTFYDEDNTVNNDEEKGEESEMPADDDEKTNYEDKETDSDEEYESDEENIDDEEYGDEKFEEGPPEGQVQSNSKLLGIIAGILVLLGLIGGGTFFFMNKNKTIPAPVPQNVQQQNQNEQPQEQQGDLFGGQGENQEEIFDENGGNNPEENPAPEENYDENQQQEEQNNQEGQLSEGDLLPPENVEVRPENPEGNINKAIVNSFNQNRSGVSLRELNWFCTTELFTDKVFKNYLQNLDNTLKQNLRNNFMNTQTTPPNDSVAAKFAVDNNGNLKKVIISNSSGSDEIDNIVLQSINETFEGEKSQILKEGSLKSDMYFLKVVIKI